MVCALRNQQRRHMRRPLNERFCSNSIIAARRSSFGLPTTTPPAAFLVEDTRRRLGMQLTSTQPDSALRCRMAQRNGRLLSPRPKAYQPSRLKSLPSGRSVAGHDG